jgi:6-phosphofructokinase
VKRVERIFRTERYSDFKKAEIQQKAVEEILRRKVKVLVGIGRQWHLCRHQCFSQTVAKNGSDIFHPRHN